MRFVILMLFASSAFAGGSSSLNLQLPSGSQNYQSDRFRAGDLDCSNAIGGSTNVEFGVTGIVNNATSIFESANPNYPETKDIGLYARIIIPLDGPRERINCNSLYEMELRKKQLEIERLEQELINLRKLERGGFEND